MTQTMRQRTAALTRHMLAEHMLFASMVWGGFVVFVAVMIIGVSIFRGIEVSGWEQAATQVPRWYLLFIGAHLANPVLPLHIAHGQTRRAFAGQAAVFVVAFAAFGAVLMAAGFVLEAGMYALAGWPQALSLSHLFTSPWELHLVVVEFWLRFMAWGAAGVLLGAAFYREQGLGAMMLLPAILLIALAEIPLAPGHWWPFGDVPPFLDLGLTGMPLLAALTVPLLSILVIAGIAWSLIKDIPLRSKGV